MENSTLNLEGYPYTFTVFTPTFNRAQTLTRVYNSLLNQTFKDFEWLIVDDGSHDNTTELVNRWMNEKRIHIHYFKQNNLGKHMAMDFAVERAKGYFFLTLDSDDSCVQNALERFVYHWETIPVNERVNFSAVTALCMNDEGKPLSKDTFTFKDSNSLDCKFKYKFETEAWGFQKTSILKEFKFESEITNCLVPESYVWFRIAEKYKTRYVNEYLRFYYTGHSSLSNSKINNKSEGSIFYYTYLLNYQLSYFKYAPIHFVYYAAKLSRYCLHNNTKLYAIYKDLKTNYAKILFSSCIPLGMVFFIYDKLNSN
jgi:glycosyltransferase involved in cell wall biosynthesis